MPFTRARYIDTYNTVILLYTKPVPRFRGRIDQRARALYRFAEDNSFLSEQMSKKKFKKIIYCSYITSVYTEMYVKQ